MALDSPEMSVQTTDTTYRAIIGLEIHVQLRTQSKMFCACPVMFEAPANSCVCPVCLGYPGALPVINRRAFDHAVLTALALNCRIARRTKWDRKSYFYPDMPKNYQISQYDLPIGQGGYFDVPVDHSTTGVRIRRAHLEEDAGKNIHDASGVTLVDLNRAGTPLLEIVTEPDLSSPEETYRFCVELQRLVTYLGVSEGNMKKGQMRFEPNVNVAIRSNGGEVRTPIVEIKNLNSFRAVRDAIGYEIKRQVEAWHADHDYVDGTRPAENRGWNADRGVTEFQRGKETAPDYRYFPDPDLVPVDVTDAMLAEYRAQLPELPLARRTRLVESHGLDPTDVETLVADRAMVDLFESALAAGGPPEITAKQFVNVWLRLANDRGVGVAELGVDARRMAELAKLTAGATVSKTAAKTLAQELARRADVLRVPTQDSREPRVSTRADAPRSEFAREKPRDEATHDLPSVLRLAEEMGLVQVRDTSATEAWVDRAFADNEKAVQDARGNPKKAKAAAGFLRGQVMKLSGGKADPKLVGDLIEQRLREPNG